MFNRRFTDVIMSCQSFTDFIGHVVADAAIGNLATLRSSASISDLTNLDAVIAGEATMHHDDLMRLCAYLRMSAVATRRAAMLTAALEASLDFPKLFGKTTYGRRLARVTKNHVPQLGETVDSAAA